MSRSQPGRRKKPRSFSGNVRRGTFWNIASTLVLRFSSVGVTAVVARILSPRDFGVFAVATTALTIVTAIGEFGVTTCLTRADLDADSLAPTLWSASLATSFLSAAVLEHFAVPIATALGSSAAAGPLRVLSIVMVLWGISSVPDALCVRDFRQNKLFLANTVGFIPSSLILLILAEHGSGAMAFAWSRVAAQGISCLVVLLSAPKLYRPGLSRPALSILYRYGIPLAIANFVGYILQNVDYVLIGHLMGPVPLGTYVLAFNVASWSSTLLLGVLTSVAMPAFSRVKQDTARLMEATSGAIRAVMLVAAPMCSLVMVLARPIVLTMYGGQWTAAVPVLMILSIYGIISVMGTLFSNMLAALGKSKSVLVIQLIWLATLVPAMAIGTREGGIVGAAFAHLIVIAPIVLPCYIFALKRAMGIKLGLIVKAALPAIAVAAIAASLAWLTASLFDSPLAQLAAGMAAGVSFYLLVTAPQVIPLLGRGLAMRPRVRSFLQAYNTIGRTLGLKVGPPARHAARSRVRRAT